MGQHSVDTLVRHFFLKDRNRLLIDPIGHVSLSLANTIPEAILWDLSDEEQPISINPLADVSDEQKPVLTDTLMEMFLNVWYGDFQATNVIDCLYNSISALLDYDRGTLLGIKEMITEKKYRDRVVHHINNPVVESFWKSEFETLKVKEKFDLIKSTRANIHQFIADPACSVSLVSLGRNYVSRISSRIKRHCWSEFLRPALESEKPGCSRPWFFQ